MPCAQLSFFPKFLFNIFFDSDNNDYLKQHRRGRYSALLGEGRLNAYLTSVDEQAHEMPTSLTVEFAKAQGIDEHLKATDQMRWVQMMNNVRNSAEETVMRELILA
ncbi:MAG: TnpV protein, partial [Clostridia bacterium]|nr:TnpV protein [Clostridia bacterium]